MSLRLKKHKRATIALGTLVEVSLWLEESTEPQAAFAAAYQSIQHIHQCMSVHSDDSDLGRYRLAEVDQHIAIHEDTFKVLNFAEQLWQQSQGMFDVCVGQALVRAAYLPADWYAPAPTLLRNTALNLYQDDNGQAWLSKQANTLIDLGGVAKGYAVDCAISALQAMGVPAALINAGGDMRIYGEIDEPIHLRKAAGVYLPLCTLRNQALASSAMPSNGQTPVEHLPIVNPALGVCLPASAHSMSVFAPSAMVADALTKLAWLNALDAPLLQRYNAELVQH